MNRTTITPEVARDRARRATEKARAKVHRARMLAEHGHGEEAREARADATEAVVLARFYRARATGATFPEAGRRAATGIVWADR